jgi:Tc5 transposase DNA-binding domain
MSNKITRTTLTNEQRLAVIRYKEKHPNTSQADIANWVKTTFGLDVHSTTIGRLLKRKGDLERDSSTKRLRAVQYPDLDNSMHEWVIRYQAHVILTDAILIEKARHFARLLNIPEDQFKSSAGWLEKFKKRHRIVKVKWHGEEASADHLAADAAIPELKELLIEYSKDDIYNMDETGLFYRCELNCL